MTSHPVSYTTGKITNNLLKMVQVVGRGEVTDGAWIIVAVPGPCPLRALTYAAAHASRAFPPRVPSALMP
jgi:hypothetical protein